MEEDTIMTDVTNQISGSKDEAVMGAFSYQRLAISWWRLLCGWLTSSNFTGRGERAVIQRDAEFPDVSFYQKNIDFVKMRGAGALGVIIRAGQNSWVDSCWYVNWEKSKAAGMPRGSYWFYDSRRDAKEQARLWASLVSADDGEMEHCADFEERYDGAFAGWRHWYDFLVEFQRITGLPDDRIGIYTGYYYWLEYGPNPITEAGSNAWFGRFPLWQAWYTDDPSVVKIPKPWNNLRHWQRGTPAVGLEYGVETIEIDMNYANMSVSEFIGKYGGSVTPPPDGGGSMKTYYLTATGDPTKQFANADGTNDVGPNIPLGTKLISHETNGVTYKMENGKYVKVKHVKLDNVTEEPTNPPPPNDLQPFDVGVMIVREGYRDGFATVHMEPK